MDTKLHDAVAEMRTNVEHVQTGGLDQTGLMRKEHAISSARHWVPISLRSIDFLEEARYLIIEAHSIITMESPPKSIHTCQPSHPSCWGRRYLTQL
jgi:hypothetical protein